MQQRDFGDAIRRWRERVTPESVGLSAGPRRRATGLRREELADLAGISVDYLTRLEQSRATSPSAQVVEALARGLRISDPERDLLFRMAGHAAPGPDVVSARITPSVQRILDRLSDTPVAVFDATWTLLAANPPYDALMGSTSTWRGIERNSVWRHLTGLGSRTVHTPDEQAGLQQHLVSDLRMTAGRYPRDRQLRALIAELTSISPLFVELWDRAEAPTSPDLGRRKTIDHPAVGHITLDCDTVIVALDDLRIMIYTAQPGTDDAERLAMATVLGTQTLA